MTKEELFALAKKISEGKADDAEKAMFLDVLEENLHKMDTILSKHHE